MDARLVRLSVMLGLLAAAGSARGQQEQAGYEYEITGSWRYVYSHVQDFALNAAGDASGLNEYLDQRLRIGTEQRMSRDLHFTGELELLYGQVAGDHDHVGAAYRDDARETLRGWDLKEAQLRQMWLRWNGPFFQLRFGQLESDWGLGLLANDGHSHMTRFGYTERGDLSDRLLLATRPLASMGGWLEKIILVLGAGFVYYDENASLMDGDVGGEMIASAFLRDNGIDLGLYVAARSQEDEEGTGLSVVAFDFFGRVDAGEGHAGLYAAAEMAVITGSTDRVIHADRVDGLEVLSLGAVLRAGWRFELLKLFPMLEVGYASGDADPHDDTVTAFSFDPEYKVGLVLFDTVLRGITAMDAQESADPDRIGEPLQGTAMLPSRGRISGVSYFYPTVQARPLDQLTLTAGFLYAWSSVDFSQSYQTFKNGGVPTNSYGTPHAGRNLGWELDLGADWRQPVWSDLHLLAGIQAGWFFPGSAFERPDGSRPGALTRVLARAALAW